MMAAAEYKIITDTGANGREFKGIVVPQGHPWNLCEQISGPGMTLNGTMWKGEFVLIFARDYDADTVIQIAEREQAEQDRVFAELNAKAGI